MEEELDTKFFEIKEKYSQQNECDTICLQERRCGEEKTNKHAIFSEAMLNDIFFAKVAMASHIRFPFSGVEMPFCISWYFGNKYWKFHRYFPEMLTMYQ